LCRLPVKLVAAQNAHLHIWVPPQALEASFAVLRAWGFRYKGHLVRAKAPLTCGSYWRQAHDLLLLGVRGRLPFQDSELLSWFNGQELSVQDSDRDIHVLIARASPIPCLDLFGSSEMEGWTKLEPG
jgi:N6-adenosine-specific RNA methylase IME4